uniref:Mitochondrial import inner membrane translocase subunit TIM23-1 n=1 Tax=Vitis vinifera TaxID=29760 RepID=A5C4I0_VITVI|nr:hypothetical protein VITISV_005782 [Vitis vinifera]
MSFDHWVFEPSFLSFLSPYHLGLRYVPCLKTTLRPWDPTSSLTASTLDRAPEIHPASSALLDAWMSSCLSIWEDILDLLCERYLGLIRERFDCDGPGVMTFSLLILSLNLCELSYWGIPPSLSSLTFRRLLSLLDLSLDLCESSYRGIPPLALSYWGIPPSLWVYRVSCIGYLSGAVPGAAKGLVVGVKAPEPVGTVKLRINQILNASSRAGRKFENWAGMIGLLYAGLENGIVVVRDAGDVVNSVVAGLSTDALYQAVAGVTSTMALL